MGPSFVHPCCVCTLTWQMSAKSSHCSISPFTVYMKFRMRSAAMITFAPRHYLTTLVKDFSLSFGHTGPGYSMTSSASSAKHDGIKKTSTPIFFTCCSAHRLLHWWSRGTYIDDVRLWHRLVYRLMMPIASLLPFPVGTYLSTLFGSIIIAV